MDNDMAVRVRSLIRGDREYAQELAQEVCMRLLRMESRGIVLEPSTLPRLVARIASRIRMSQWRQEAHNGPLASLQAPLPGKRARTLADILPSRSAGPLTRVLAKEALQAHHQRGGARAKRIEVALEALNHAQG